MPHNCHTIIRSSMHVNKNSSLKIAGFFSHSLLKLHYCVQILDVTPSTKANKTKKNLSKTMQPWDITSKSQAMSPTSWIIIQQILPDLLTNELHLQCLHTKYHNAIHEHPVLKAFVATVLASMKSFSVLIPQMEAFIYCCVFMAFITSEALREHETVKPTCVVNIWREPLFTRIYNNQNTYYSIFLKVLLKKYKWCRNYWAQVLGLAHNAK